MLNLSDGAHSLLDIAERSGYTFDTIKRAAEILLDADCVDDERFFPPVKQAATMNNTIYLAIRRYYARVGVSSSSIRHSVRSLFALLLAR